MGLQIILVASIDWKYICLYFIIYFEQHLYTCSLY